MEIVTKPKVRACFRGADQFKHLFKQSKCVVPISVGQDYHEGEKFEATLKLINENFKECVIMVCDSLQRHTIQFKYNLSSCQAHQRAYFEGDAWLERNEKYINLLEIPHKIFRWNDWLRHPEYQKVKGIVENLYETNKSMRDTFMYSILEFINRLKKTKSNFNVSQGIHYSLKYLIDEASVVLLWKAEKFDFEIYPANQTLILKAMHDHFFRFCNTELQRWIPIRFYTN